MQWPMFSHTKLQVADIPLILWLFLSATYKTMLSERVLLMLAQMPVGTENRACDKELE